MCLKMIKLGLSLVAKKPPSSTRDLTVRGHVLERKQRALLKKSDEPSDKLRSGEFKSYNNLLAKYFHSRPITIHL